MEWRKLLVLGIVASGLALVCPSAALASVYSNSTSPINGAVTPNMGALGYPVTNFTTTVTFNYDGTSTDSGVIVDEQGGSGNNAGWHDSQVELATDGTVHVAVWQYNNGGGGDLSFPKLDDNVGANTLTYAYDNATQMLTANLNGFPATPVTKARQDPIDNGQGAQIWAFGVPDDTSLTGASGAYPDTISSVTIIATPEPASLGFLALCTVGLLARQRSNC